MRRPGLSQGSVHQHQAKSVKIGAGKAGWIGKEGGLSLSRKFKTGRERLAQPSAVAFWRTHQNNVVIVY